MKVLYNWLKDFVDIKVPAEELASRLPLSGSNIGAVEDSPSGAVLDTDLTSNRPDCLGHYGMAREVAALYRLPLKRVFPKVKEASEKAADAVRVEIESPELCGRFTARVIRGVKIQPSPAWLRERLEALGQASINNVVDATNYALLDLGHPLHAFDYDLIAEHRIVVRRARGGEKIKTLDGIQRALSTETCMVAPAKQAVGIGGMMGGAKSAISSASKNVLLE
jgi:phenylalanyl-tRNA synthetase beta chain